MTRFEDTAAADLDLESVSAGGVTFVKLIDLEEVEFTVLAAKVAPSTYPNSSNDAAFITFTYPDDDEGSEDVCQVSTEQSAIKKQVQLWISSKVEFPIYGVTVREFATNTYGTKRYCLASAVPAEVEEVKPSAPKRPVVDHSEDTKRSVLSSRPVGRPSPKVR